MSADAQSSKPDWGLNLLDSEVEFVQSFVDQVPEQLGARDKFVKLLKKISGVAAVAGEATMSRPWRYYFVDENGSVYGSNDEDVAERAKDSEDGIIVIDADSGEVMDPHVSDSVVEVEDVWGDDGVIGDGPDR